jgi:mRNA interferase YafQ
MLSIRTATRFRKSYKKILKSGSFDRVKLEKVVDILSHEDKLPVNYKDHSLTGDMAGSRECHIEYNLLLIYKIEGENLLLADIGSHPELFG